jgi:hypothetical protein
LKIRGAQGGHWPEAVPFGKVVDAANDELFGSLQFFDTGGPEYGRHGDISLAELCRKLQRSVSGAAIDLRVGPPFARRGAAYVL